MNTKIISLAIALAVAISAAAFVFNRKSAQPDAPETSDSALDQTGPMGGASTTATKGMAVSADSNAGADARFATSMPTQKAVPWNGNSDDADAAKENAKLNATPLSPEEKKSLAMMTNSLVKYIQPKHSSPESMLSDMRKAGLKPIIAKDFNQYTGKMIVVRSEEALPGTRYQHAQFFEDESKEQFAQHISFELRPSSDGMKSAMAAAEAAIKATGEKAPKPTKVDENFLFYTLKDNKQLWIKKLATAEELSNDPFNAHDPKLDLGTLKIAVEMTPAGHEGDGGEHGGH